MTQHDVLIAIFAEHRAANTAVDKLIKDSFDMKSFSVIGKGYHTEEKIVGEYMSFWGKYGAFLGGLWGGIFGGIFLTISVIGPVGTWSSCRDYHTAIEGAIVVGGLTVLGTAPFSLGIPKTAQSNMKRQLKQITCSSCMALPMK